MARFSAITASTPVRTAAVRIAVASLVMGGAGPVLAAITHTVTIQPIQVRDNAGANGANAGRLLWENFADKIWDQAGIDVNFLSWRTLDKTAYQSIDDATEFNSLTQDNGNQQNANASVINMYFVKTLYAAPGNVTYGLAWTNGKNGVAIADPTFSYNNGTNTNGRFDTLAHEIGHNLGLVHAGGALRLMAEGNIRTIPTVLGDVFPDGLKTDQLIQSEITTALASGFAVAVPTPGSVAMLGLSGLVATRRRRAARG